MVGDAGDDPAVDPSSGKSGRPATFSVATLETDTPSAGLAALEGDDDPKAVRWLCAVTEATRLLVQTPQFAVALPKVLAIVGQLIRADRVSLERLDGVSGNSVVSAEWSREGTPPGPQPGIAADVRPDDEPGDAWDVVLGGATYQTAGKQRGGKNGEVAAGSGVRSKLMVPVVVEAAVWGGLSIEDVSSGRSWAEEEVEVARAIAEALSGAIQRERLENAAGIASSERAAAEELALANRAMGDALAGIVHLRDLEEFLGELLKQSLEVTGACSGAITVIHEEEIEHLAIANDAGLVPRQAAIEAGVCRFPYSPEIQKLTAAIVQSPEQWLIGPEHPAHPPVMRRFHAEVGNKLIGIVPMMVGERLIGWLGLGFKTENAPARSRVTLLRGLAGYATLAVEMTRLAEVARKVAAAEELALANRAMGDALAGIVGLRDLEAFLAELLKQCISCADAHSGAIVLVKPDHVEFPVIIAHGKRIPNKVLQEKGVDTVPFSDELRRYADSIVRSPEEWMIRTDHPVHPPSFQRFHAEIGNVMAGHVPMLAGNELVGWLGLGFKDENAPARSRVTLLRVLASYATLAVQMARLAEAARDSAVADERMRLAREIHDTLAQGFVGIIINLRAARGAADPVSAARCLAIAEDLARENLAAARESVRALRPGPKVPECLAASLRTLCEVMASRSDVPVVFDGPPGPVTPPGEVHDEVWRIVQEALNNAVRHSAATQIIVSLARKGKALRIGVRDNGRGFDPTLAVPGRFGIAGIRERAARIEAGLTLTSEVGKGTELTVIWPKSQAVPAEGTAGQTPIP